MIYSTNCKTDDLLGLGIDTKFLVGCLVGIIILYCFCKQYLAGKKRLDDDDEDDGVEDASPEKRGSKISNIFWDNGDQAPSGSDNDSDRPKKRKQTSLTETIGAMFWHQPSGDLGEVSDRPSDNTKDSKVAKLDVPEASSRSGDSTPRARPGDFSPENSDASSPPKRGSKGRASIKHQNTKQVMEEVMKKVADSKDNEDLSPRSIMELF